MAKEKNETIKEAEEELEHLTGEEAEKRMAFLKEKWEMDRISFEGAARKERHRNAVKQNGMEMRNGETVRQKEKRQNK